MENESLKNRFHQKKGRGAGNNPANPWNQIQSLENPEIEPENSILTEILPDHSKTVLNKVNSPDLGFHLSLNPYRGCEHGCIYCYARPFHEYFGLSAGLDFETKILVKKNLASLLRNELKKPGYQAEHVVIGSATDAYQPLERKLMLTRQALEVLEDFAHPLAIITKNHLVTRDVDILSRMGARNLATVMISLTSLDSDILRKMEPRASFPEARLKAIETLSKAGVSVGVNLSPIVPGLTDHEIPNLLKAAKEAGASYAHMILVRLPGSVGPMFLDWLETHFPLKKQKIENRIRSMRDGELNDARFHHRFQAEGNFADQSYQLFDLHLKKQGLQRSYPNLDKSHFRIPGGQLTFHDLMRQKL